MNKYLFTFLCLFANDCLCAQGIKGLIINEKQEPIPFANIFVPLLQTGAGTNEQGFYQLNLPTGTYDVIISSIGYESRRIEVVIGDEMAEQNFVLQSQNTELEEFTVRASRKDPAYAIIQLAIEHRDKYRTQVASFKSQVYIKAIEEISSDKAEKMPKTADDAEDGQAIDPFEGVKKEQQALMASLNMVEMELTLNFQAPNLYKEERTAYKAYGDKSGLLLPLFGETDFNFYDNLVYLKGIADAPIISPISRTAILSYKYKLEESVQEGAYLVHKIKIMPRNQGGYSTVSGYIYINEGLWNINRLDVALAKSAAKLYDQFSLQQAYSLVNDSLWMPTRQKFLYETAQGQHKKFKGSTLISWTNFQPNHVFPAKFFGTELAVTTQAAYERDSSYWQQVRTEPLMAKEIQVVHLRDSIELAHKSPAYRDSVEAKYNHITAAEVFFTGVGFRKEEKKRQIYIGSLIDFVGFSVVGGFRLGPYLSYFKQWKNGRLISTNGSFNLGLRNLDVMGSGSVFYRYQPFRLGDVRVTAGRNFQSVNPYGAYLSQLRVSNYILNDYASVWHNIELFNGFYFGASANFRNRYSIDGLDTQSFLSDAVTQTDPEPFTNYQAFITELKLSYTPKQRYMTEPNRKVVLGSKYPTLSILYRKGWNGLMGSDIDFDYWEVALEQNVVFGTLGNTKYGLRAGKFTNTADLRFVDIKRIRQSDPYLYSDPMQTFQLLDTALITSKFFFEAHHIHHFNGAFLNSLPLIKHTKISLVAGAGMMWLQENNYRHEELFGGLERVFKLSARRRMRIGIYGVLAESNKAGLNQGFKISFDIIDTWKKEWSY